MPQTKPIVSIENVVASADVFQKMDLNKITRIFPCLRGEDAFYVLEQECPKAFFLGQVLSPQNSPKK